jgi:hypothetical protein
MKYTNKRFIFSSIIFGEKRSRLLAQKRNDLIPLLIRQLGPGLHMHADRDPLLMGEGIGGRRIMTSLAIFSPKLRARLGSHFLALYAATKVDGQEDHKTRDGRPGTVSYTKVFHI